MTKRTKGGNRYAQLIERIFERHYQLGQDILEFERAEIIEVAQELGIELPLNLGDVLYSFKYRANLPVSITERAPEGKEWVIANRGRSKYAFVAKVAARILPDSMLTYTKIPDATPGIVEMHSFDDEQALLTKLRYNRLLDIFTGVTCYSLQNHLRTTVPGVGQVETDEVYVGVDRRGQHYVFPVQAKGGTDELGVVQIEQDIALCQHKFPALTCRAIAAQFMKGSIIALFEFELVDGEIRKLAERHYSLVPAEEVGAEDLLKYAERPDLA